MTVALWVVLFVVQSAFWAWVLFGGGAEWLEGTFFANLLLGFRPLDWSAGAIKLVGGAIWLACLFWFVLGLFVPTARTFGVF